MGFLMDGRTMASLSPTQRTLRLLRQEGCLCGIVERFNTFAGPIVKGRRVGIRQDLFQFIDIVAILPIGICGVQSCGQAFSEHNKKILENEIAPEWLKAGGFIYLYGWRKLVKRRGLKQKIWSPRIKEYTLEDFE